jgi:transglutaminase/protease-like cytokinesis protein 3
MDMLEAVVYDDAALNDEARTDDGFTAIGVFQDGQAVCNGYSQAYMGLLKDMDIPAILISSDVDDHAWNMIYIDGEWSYVDSTWEDDTYETSDNWYYFLLDQEELEYDHRFDSGNGDTLNAKDYLEFAHYVFPKTSDAQ